MRGVHVGQELHDAAAEEPVHRGTRRQSDCRYENKKKLKWGKRISFHSPVYVVNLNLLSAVDELDERQVLLVDGLVHRLVVLDPLLEIFVRLFLVRVGAVVLVVHLDLPDVAVDDVRVGAHGLDEQQLQRQAVQRRTDPLAPFLRRVRGVEDGDAAGIRRALFQVTAQVFLEQKVDQIFQRGSGERPSQRVVLAVAPEELAVRARLAHHLTSVRAHVEHLGPRAVKEPKILAQPFRHVRLT